MLFKKFESLPKNRQGIPWTIVDTMQDWERNKPQNHRRDIYGLLIRAYREICAKIITKLFSKLMKNVYTCAIKPDHVSEPKNIVDNEGALVEFQREFTMTNKNQNLTITKV